MNTQQDLRPATAVEHADYLAGYRTFPGSVETEDGLMVPAHHNVVIWETYFREDDIVDGDFPRDDTRSTVYDADDVDDAVRIIRRECCTFAATGTDWAADPDGSHIVDYVEGRRVETTAHLAGWTDDERAAIIDGVG